MGPTLIFFSMAKCLCLPNLMLLSQFARCIQKSAFIRCTTRIARLIAKNTHTPYAKGMLPKMSRTDHRGLLKQITRFAKDRKLAFYILFRVHIIDIKSKHESRGRYQFKSGLLIYVLWIGLCIKSKQVKLFIYIYSYSLHVMASW